jgi:hypothetical protein
MRDGAAGLQGEAPASPTRHLQDRRTDVEHLREVGWVRLPTRALKAEAETVVAAEE